MFPREYLKRFLLFVTLLIQIQLLVGQDVTIITGKVIDKFTKEPLPFVDVYFSESNVGSSTDLDGKYRIDTRYATDSITATFIGYTDQTLAIKKDVRKQEVNFEIENSSIVMETAVISAKKEKYSKKNNPAVDLIKKVMDNKKENSLKGQDFYSYDKQEIIELDVNNITDQLKERKFMKSMSFINDFIDTSEVNGKLFLPMFLKETLSSVYYRKSDDTKKEVRKALQYTEFDDLIDDKSVDGVSEVLYQDIDIYEDIVPILASQFISPLAPVGVNFYRYYIIDTLYYKGDSVINLAFIPKNKLNKGFTGNLYITHKDNYFVKKADLGIIGGISLNFVRDLKIEHEFERKGETFALVKDFITVDYSLSKNGLGLFGTKETIYNNYKFSPPEDMSVFDAVESTIDAEDISEKDDNYWIQNRIAPLSTNMLEAYSMIDSLNKHPTFKRIKSGVKILTTGYVPVGPIDIGPVPTFFSANDVEGSRFKFAAETGHRWNKKFRLGGYVAYGTRDKALKFSTYGLYSFNDDFKENPRHFIYVEHSHDVNFPGVDLDFIKTDNVLLSVRRGITDKMLFNRLTRIDYTIEGGVLDYTFIARKDSRVPHGNLELPFQGEDGTEFLTEINTFELGMNIRWAPNEKFLQGRQYRTQLFTKFPVFTLQYRAGIKGLLGGDYNYHKLSLNLFKKFNLKRLGHSLFEIEAGKVIGNDLPFVLLKIPRANQTFSYQLRSYNMMNFLEFATDQYAEMQIQHFFGGYFMNRLPLLKKLKLREVVSAKVIYGRFTDGNNPELSPNLPQFQVDESGIPETYSLDNEPYIEVSGGFYNIFKVLRIDIVKRLTYLENPSVPEIFGVKGMGIRGRFKVEF